MQSVFPLVTPGIFHGNLLHVIIQTRKATQNFAARVRAHIQDKKLKQKFGFGHKFDAVYTALFVCTREHLLSADIACNSGAQNDAFGK